MQLFAPIVWLAIRWRDRPAYHKRLMLLSNASILEAVVGRLLLHAVADIAPLSFYLGADLVIVAGALYDATTRGSIHPVWKWAAAAPSPPSSFASPWPTLRPGMRSRRGWPAAEPTR